MIYRKFIKGGILISQLGFGAMRFPTINNESNIDISKTEKMLDFAIYSGINYIDTAYPYHDGMSEVFLGEYFEKRGLREKIYLATKLPVWKIEKYDDFDFYLNLQLNRLKTKYIDFYLLHSLWKNSWEKVKNLNVIDWLIKKKKEGKIKFFGFSFHDEFDVFKEIIDFYDWDFCQIQLNYMDINYQAGEKGLSYAANKGIQVIIMEPNKGGKLASPPLCVLKIFESYNIKRSSVEWALSYLFNKKEVLTVLSGMSDINQVKENIKIASEYNINSLTQKDLEVLNKAREAWLNLKTIDCTNCKYCLPCPYGVNIPANFEIYNNFVMYGDLKEALWDYEYLKENERASNCRECGECEEKCPQNLPIRDLLRKIRDNFKSL